MNALLALLAAFAIAAGVIFLGMLADATCLRHKHKAADLANKAASDMKESSDKLQSAINSISHEG